MCLLLSSHADIWRAAVRTMTGRGGLISDISLTQRLTPVAAWSALLLALVALLASSRGGAATGGNHDSVASLRAGAHANARRSAPPPISWAAFGEEALSLDRAKRGGVPVSADYRVTMRHLFTNTPLAFWMVLPAKDSAGGSTVAATDINSKLYDSGVWFEGPEMQLATTLFSRLCGAGGGRVFDVGSNTGFYSALAIAHGCHATTVDGSRDVLLYFAATRALNRWGDDVSTVVNRVASDFAAGTFSFDGWTTHKDGAKSSGAAKPATDASYPSSATVEPVSQTPVRLDALINDVPVAFLKIDVESNEPDVFRSGGAAFANHLVLNILFEFSYAYRGKDMREAYRLDVWKPLWDSGYTCYTFSAPRVQITDITLGRWEDSAFRDCQAQGDQATCGVNIWCTLEDANVVAPE